MKRNCHIILFFVLEATLSGCRSNKEVVSNTTLSVDSIARSAHHHTMAVIDSLVRNIDFSFDTLKINIERPSSVCDRPEVIRLKAVRGRVIDQRRVHRDSVEVCNRLDTVAYHQSAAETSTEHTATMRLYNPPDATLLIGIAIVIIAVGYILYIRTRA